MTGPKESGEAGNGSPALTGRGVIVASEAGRDVVSAGRKARTAMTQLSATTATMTAAAIFQAPTPAGRGGASVGTAWPADCPAHPRFHLAPSPADDEETGGHAADDGNQHRERPNMMQDERVERADNVDRARRP